MPEIRTPPPTDRADLARALFEESGDALFLIDPVTGGCVDANPVALRLSGYTRDELREMAAAHLLRHEAGGSSRIRNALAHTDRHLHGLDGFLLRTRDDSNWIPVSLTVTRLHLDRPLGLITARDARDQRATLAKVRQLEAEWRRVLASVSDCLWSGEMTADGQWSYRYLSPVVEAIAGRPAEDFLDGRLRWMDVAHPDDRRRIEAVERELLAGRADAVVEYRIVRPDGVVHWVRDSMRASPGRTGRRLDGVLADVSDQKAAEEALRASREQVARVLEASADGIVFVGSDSRVQLANPAAEALVGYPPGGLLGVTWADLAAGWTHPDGSATRRDEQADFRVLVRGEAVAGVVRVRVRPDGSRVIIRGNAAPVRDAAGAVIGMVAAVRDVTEAWLAIEALREGEARYRDLVEQTPVAIYEEDLTAVAAWMDELRSRGVTDLRAHLAENPDDVSRAVGLIRVRDVNRAAVEQAGAADKEELLANLPRLFSDHARAGFAEELVALWEGRDEFEFEARAWRLDGRPADLIVRLHVRRRDGRPDLGAVIVTATDITARRRAEEARDRERHLLRAVLNAIPDMVSYKDDADVYQGCNPAFARFFGLRDEEVAGRTLRDLFPPAAADALAAADARLLAGGPPERADLRLPAADGRHVLFESIRAPLTDPAGRPAGVIAISRDITARRQVEDQVRQAAKLEAVGQLAGGVAHEFNNLLTAVLGNLSLAHTLLPEGHQVRELLAAGEKAAWRAAELTKQLLSFARRTNVKLEPADLNASVGEAVATLRLTFDARVTIDLRTDPRLSPVLADLTQLGQMLTNLCRNARDAMPAGGTLTITTADVAVDAAHVKRVPAARVGEFVRLTVADTGTGIAADVRDRIFEPFFTTKEVGQGTGLGLALVHGVVTQHGGWVEVESAPGRGARFDVYLPRATDPTVRAGSVSDGKQSPSLTLPARTTTSKTVLLADDEPMIRTLGRTILEDLGYRVLLAADGAEAVDVYRREAGRVDLVILDLTMPRLGGREACRELARIDPRVRVLLSSGYLEDAAGARPEPGFRGFVAKPYRPSDLAAAVKAALA